jgi:protein gp37
MSTQTSIEWTESTWNPITGCTKVSPGCDHCYAETFAERFRGTPGHYFENGFDVVLRPDKLDLPLKWKRPRKIFVNSMSDLFHDAVPDEYIVRVFEVMAKAPHHTFQVLTKRHARMRALLQSDGLVQRRVRDRSPAAWPLPNVWVGVSAENQQWADIRIPALLDTPAAVRWISAEPLLGPINLRTGRYAMPPDGEVLGTTLDGIDWVVAGGESGRGARPMDPDWARSLRDQCAAADVAFLFKQWGQWVTEDQSPEDIVLPGTSWLLLGNDGPSFYKVGKKAAGRELDGEIHDGYPAMSA